MNHTHKTQINALLTSTLAWSLFIVVGMFMPRNGHYYDPSYFLAKLAHILLFGAWAVLVYYTLYQGQTGDRKPPGMLLIWISGTVFGALTELGQYLGPFGRSGTLSDVALNSFSVALGYFIARILHRFLPDRHSAGAGG